ncbi:MAG: hypothetical protein HQ561_13880 [Desulfobacteraceae bacterium]|nr:hypothetical protein [Desulfobacteraceae bacterium]
MPRSFWPAAGEAAVAGGMALAVRKPEGEEVIILVAGADTARRMARGTATVTAVDQKERVAEAGQMSRNEVFFLQIINQ